MKSSLQVLTTHLILYRVLQKFKWVMVAISHNHQKNASRDGIISLDSIRRYKGLPPQEAVFFHRQIIEVIKDALQDDPNFHER